MGEALVSGLLGSGWAGPEDIVVAEKLEGRRRELAAAGGLAQLHAGLTVTADPVPAEGAVVAVKPDDVEAACRAIAKTGAHRVLSIAAGIPLNRLEEWLGGDRPAGGGTPH